MSTLTKAGEDAQRLAAMFSGLAGLADELQRVGSLQQAESEAQTRLDAVNAEIAKREADDTKRFKEEQDAAVRAMADAQAKTVDIQKQLDDVAAQGVEIVAAAQREADRIVAAARDEAVRVRAEAMLQVRDVENTRSDILQQIDAALLERDTQLDHVNKLKQDAAAEASRLADTTAELDRLRKLFGGKET